MPSNHQEPLLPQRPYLLNLWADRWLVLLVAATVIILSVVYVVLFFKPSYKTEATVLLKNTAIGAVVSNIETERANQPTTAAASPMMIHVSILESRNLSTDVYRSLRQKFPKSVPAKAEPQKFLKRYLKVNSVISSDAIELVFKWGDPKEAKLILEEVLDQYMAAYRDINRKIVDKKREYLDREMQTIQEKLAEVRNRIQVYSQEHNTISVDAESAELIRQRASLKDKLANASAQVNNTRSAITRLQSELGMTSKEAIQAVALGSQNTSLVDMQDDLAKVNQEISYEGIRLAPTNPKMVALKQKASTIKNMIQRQMRQSLGSNVSLPSEDVIPLRGSSAATVERPPIRIYDSVRTDMASQLVSLRVRLKGLEAERNTISNSLSKIKSLESQMPGKQLALKELAQEEDNLAMAYDEVRKKQIEASLHDADLNTNAVVLDEPYLPSAPSAPHRWNIVFLATLLGLISGAAISIIKSQAQEIQAQAVHQLNGH